MKIKMDMDKYEEALERAKAGKPIDEVFPELKESEDERIRKALLRCCDDWEKGQYGCMNAADIPSIRAYLEKQKEQEPLDIPSAGSGAQGTTPPLFKLDVKPAEWSEVDKKMLRTILQQDEKAIELEMCSQAYWEERGWIMIPPDVTLEGINSLLKQVRKKLGQEQPELKKEIEEWWQNWTSPPRNEYAVFNNEDFINLARHFYSLGLNARKEE